MQEENKQETPMVDIDTSGPSAEVELNDDVQTEEQVETKEQETSPEPQAASTEEASGEKQEASDEKESKDKELENYSKDVQRRIAKLTKKWREAERQREEALAFAKNQKDQKEKLQKDINNPYQLLLW